MTEDTPEGWERINTITNRMEVPGGWIYEVRNSGIVFVSNKLDHALVQEIIGATLDMIEFAVEENGGEVH
jgi:hypothetical protein